MMSVSNASVNAMIEPPCPAVRDRLLDVALQLFAEKGYEATTIREIALAADVTKPTIYYYFTSKENLYGELANSLCESIENKMILSSFDDESARKKIKLFLLKIIHSINGNDDNRKFIYILIKGSKHHMTSMYLLRLVDTVKVKLGGIINNGISSGEFLIEDIEYAVCSLMSYTLLCIYDSIYNEAGKTDMKEIDVMLDKILDRIAL